MRGRAVRAHASRALAQCPVGSRLLHGPGEHRDTDPKKVDLETVQA